MGLQKPGVAIAMFSIEDTIPLIDLFKRKDQCRPFAFSA